MVAEQADAGRLEREMGITHDELFRLLPRAVGENPYRIERDRVVIEVGKGRVTVELGREGERRIALLRLPVTPVSITWEGVEGTAFDRFLAHFDRTYQRGGG